MEWNGYSYGMSTLMFGSLKFEGIAILHEIIIHPNKGIIIPIDK